MNQKRQPKGTDTGGQFAPDCNPESTVLLLAAPSTCVVCGDQNHLGVDCPLAASLRNPESEPDIDAGEVCLSCGTSVAWGSGSYVNRIPSDRDGISGFMCGSCGSCEDDIKYLWCENCKDYTAGIGGYCRDCGETQDENNAPVPAIELDLCTECTGETNFDFEAFADKLRVERDGYEPPFQIGSVLEYDVEVVPWVPDMHEENVAVQVWMKEWGDADNDCAGWEPRAIAQIARERGITNVTNRDLQDILDDPDISKIAFRPDTSITRLIKQINALNKLNKEDSTS